MELETGSGASTDEYESAAVEAKWKREGKDGGERPHLLRHDNIKYIRADDPINSEEGDRQTDRKPCCA